MPSALLSLVLNIYASVVLNGPVTNLWTVSSLIPESLSFTSTGNPVRISPRISADELLQTLSYCQGEFQGWKVLIIVRIIISITGWKRDKKLTLYKMKASNKEKKTNLKLYIFDELTNSLWGYTDFLLWTVWIYPWKLGCFQWHYVVLGILGQNH